MAERLQIRRRHFLAGAAAVWTAKSYAAVQGANERLRIGVIGCGGMAGVHMGILVKNKERDNAEIVKVCDIYTPRLEKAAQLTGAAKVRDYRTLLEDKDIDYVLIATPEHWHAQMTLDALDAGKHVYVEKPMTHQVDEAKKVIAKLKQKPNLKLQVGVQGMSDNSYESAYEYVKNGAIGKVVIAQIDYSRNHVDDYWAYPIDEGVAPGPDLDWKAWLGPAPKRDWDPNRYFRWRWFWDYSGGIATDLFIHRATRLIKALNLGFPEYCAASGGKFQFVDSKAEVPDTFNAQADYPGGPTMLLVSSMANSRPVEHVLRGHKATLTFTRTGFTITPEREFAKDVQPFEFTKTGSESVDPHHRNLQNAIRQNEPIRCDAELGYKAMVVCKMAVESYRKRQYVKWDSMQQRIRKA
jgi:predicted dehydrogenase